MLGRSIYAYLWRTSRQRQVQVCLLVACIAPLAMLPLELQRRIVDHVTGGQTLTTLLLLGLAYLVVIFVSGGLKYQLNVFKGRILEEVTRDLRTRIVKRVALSLPPAEATLAPMDSGTAASMLAAETEVIGGFASECLSTPLLQITTMLWVLGFLIWVEPRIALLAMVVYAPQLFLVPKIQQRINRLSRMKTRIVRRLCQDIVDVEELSPHEQDRGRVRASLRIQQIFKLRMYFYRQKYVLTLLGNFLDALGPLIVLVVGGHMVLKGQTNISTLVVFISGFQKLSEPWNQMVTFYRSVSIARVTFGLVAEALDATPAASRRRIRKT